MNAKQRLLQYKAELNQGLNELAGNGSAEGQLFRQILADLEKLSKNYIVQSELVDPELHEAVPLSDIRRYFDE